MSTSCRIGYLKPDGKVESIYCHWDGGPEGVGKILRDHYMNIKDIEELMKLGDISSLGDTPEHRPEDWRFWQREYKRTLCYKDRGEADVDSIVSDSEEEYRDKVKRSSVNYGYLFKNGKWEVL